MADLIRTVDIQDGEELDASGDEGGPVMSARLKFNDITSDGEDEGPQVWDFDGHNAVEVNTGNAEPPMGLEAKIQARLQEKHAQDGGDAAARANLEQADQKRKKAREKHQAEEAAKDIDGHLRTGMQFSALRLSRPLLRAVAELGFDSPTPIQRDVIPPALQGLDVLATAETGSGKTASFLLPALERLCQSVNVRARKRNANGRIVVGQVATKAMILIPTRELAVQCHAMLKDLAKHTMVTYQLVAGGFVSQEQASSLRQQPDIVIATPGRLLDHLLNTASVHMELLEIVVFDEADRLLEMGFRNECQQVLKLCSKGRQTMLFSATLNASVEDLAALALVKPVRVHANAVNQVVETLEQEFVKAPSAEMREAVLLSLCTRNYTTRVIVFCATRHTVHRLAIIFGLCGMSFAEIHGNLPQGERVQALQQFQHQEKDFLLATDLAARGLDLVNVETVINFNIPFDVSRYVHRVGRTARMGRAGRAVTIYAPDEYSKVKKLGRQCCTKVKSKVLKRSVAQDVIDQWTTKIRDFEEDVTAILQDESMERELRIADMFVNKSDNLAKHKDAIHARPAKQWYMTNAEKHQLKDEELKNLQESEEAAEKEEEMGSNKRKRGREKETEEQREARMKQRAKERFKKKQQEERAEKMQAEQKIRANARRFKKKSRNNER